MDRFLTFYLKGWLLVKKFFAMLLCFGLVCGMSAGLVGCDKGTTTKTEKKVEEKKDGVTKSEETKKEEKKP